MINKSIQIYNKLNQDYAKHMKIFRYLVSGGMATATNLFFLFIFANIVGIWYITSEIMAYIISYVVSFTMQKYWTFNDGSKDKIKSQAIIYTIVTTANLGLNALILYVLVQYGHLNHLIGQVIASAIIAVESYFIYKVLFRPKDISEQIS